MEPNLCGPLAPRYTLAEDCYVAPTIASYLHPLKDFKIGERNPTTRPLEECLSAALHAYTAILRQEGLLGSHPAACYFFSLPLPAAQPKSQSGTSGTLYVYGWSSQNWTPDHETALSDMANAASLQYEEAYSEVARTEVSRLARNRLIESASHELQTVLSNIQEGISGDILTLIRGHVRLQLGLRVDEDIFISPLNSLRNDAPQGLKQLSRLAYALYQLSKERYIAQQLSETSLNTWFDECKRMISIAEDIPRTCLSALPVDKDRSLHLLSAYFSALSNCIKHTTAWGDDGRIVVRASRDAIVITNYYKSTLSHDEDRKPLEEKRRLAGENSAFGSEMVISYHLSRFLEIDIPMAGWEILSQLPNQDASGSGSHRYQHAWQTRLPLSKKVLVGKHDESVSN